MLPSFVSLDLIQLDRTEDGFAEVVFEASGLEVARTVVDLKSLKDCEHVSYPWWIELFRRYC